MATGIGIGIPFRRFGTPKPCPLNLVFQSKEIQGNLLLDKTAEGNDAKLIQSNCLILDGINNVISLTRKDLWLEDTRNPWSIQLYVNIPNNPTTISPFFFNRVTEGIFIYMGSNGIIDVSFVKEIITNQIRLRTVNVLPLNQFVNVLITYNGSKNGSGVNIYFNGVLQNKTIVYDNLTTDILNTANTSIPVFGTWQGAYFKGIMFGIKAWKSVQLPNSTAIPDLFDIPIGEGAGDITHDRSINANHGLMANFNLATCWTKQDELHSNIKNGFDLWQNNVTPTTLLRVPFNQLGASIKTQGDTITGYTWVSRNPAIKGGNNNSETQIDYTNNGANTQIPSDLNAYAFNSTPASLGERFFRRSLYDNNDVKIGEDRFCIYASTVDNLGVSIDFPTTVENNYAIIVYSTNNEQSTYTATNVIALTLPEIIVILKDKINLQGYYVAEYDGTSEVLNVYNGTRTLYREGVGAVPTSIITLITTPETAEPPSGACLKRTLNFTNMTL